MIASLASLVLLTSIGQLPDAEAWKACLDWCNRAQRFGFDEERSPIERARVLVADLNTALETPADRYAQSRCRSITFVLVTVPGLQWETRKALGEQRGNRAERYLKAACLQLGEVCWLEDCLDEWMRAFYDTEYSLRWHLLRGFAETADPRILPVLRQAQLIRISLNGPSCTGPFGYSTDAWLDIARALNCFIGERQVEVCLADPNEVPHFDFTPIVESLLAELDTATEAGSRLRLLESLASVCGQHPDSFLCALERLRPELDEQHQRDLDWYVTTHRALRWILDAPGGPDRGSLEVLANQFDRAEVDRQRCWLLEEVALERDVRLERFLGMLEPGLDWQSRCVQLAHSMACFNLGMKLTDEKSGALEAVGLAWWKGCGPDRFQRRSNRERDPTESSRKD